MVLEASDSWSRQPNFLGVVTAKSGTTVTVRRAGDPPGAPTYGPFNCEAGVSGFVAVGDTVIIDRSSGVPVVKMPVEVSERANMLQLVASSGDAVLTTRSVTDWEEVVRLEGLSIPPTNYAQLIWFARGVRTTPFGPVMMQCRIRFNDTLMIEGTGGQTLEFDLFPTPEASGGFNVANWYITPHFTGVGGGSETRFVSALAGAFGETQFVGTADEPTINSISIEARTLDTNGENDELRFTRVRLFA